MTDSSTALDWNDARKLFESGGLSVILPLHNTGEQTAENLERLNALLNAEGFPYSLIPVDDGSSDNTRDVLEYFATQHASCCSPVYCATNIGKGAAILEGLKLVRTEWTLLLDGDLDLDPAMLPAFCSTAIRTGAEVVVGSKRHPNAEVQYPLRRRVASSLYRFLVQRLLHLNLSDTQSGMKLFKTEALQRIAEKLLVKRFAFDLEVLTVAREYKIPIAEAPVRILTFGRKWGCLTLSVFWRTFIDTLAIAYRERILHYYASITPSRTPTPSTKRPYFSVIVACPGDSTVLRRLMDALREQTYRDFEVLFLPDRLLVRPETNYRFRIIATGSVRPAKKRNMGALAATGDVLAFIDDDAYPRPDWLASAAVHFATSTENADGSLPSPDALGGPGLTPPEDPPLAQLSGCVLASPLVSGNFRYRYFVQGKLHKIEDFPSCNLFVKKSVFDAIHGFREDFWPGEDTLLCADLQRQGYSLWYDPRVVVYHHRRPLFLPHLRQVGRYALHRGFFARRIGLNSRRLSYLLPSLFVLGLCLGAPLACFIPWVAILYIATCSFYLLLTLADAVLESPAPKYILMLWAGIICTHVWYGCRFILGFCSKKMPCGVRPFDHR